MSADCGHEDWMLLPAYRAMTEDRVPTLSEAVRAVTEYSWGLHLAGTANESEAIALIENLRRASTQPAPPLDWQDVSDLPLEGAAPRAEGHAFNPSCPCRECHLEAEAEEATWD